MPACTVLAPLALLAAAADDEPWLRFRPAPERLVAPAPVTSPDHEADLAWADLDRDGRADIVVVRKEPFAHPGGRSGVLLMNEGGALVDRTARLAAASDVDGDRGLLEATNDRDVAIGDLDGDGYPEVVTAADWSPGAPQRLSHPRVYGNLGAGDEGAWRGLEHRGGSVPRLLHLGSGAPVTPRFVSLDLGDVDGDGDLDLYLGDGDYTPGDRPGSASEPAEEDADDRLLLNDGRGVFEDATAERVSAEVRKSPFCTTILLEDFDLDGRVDLLQQNGHGFPGTTALSYNDPERPGHFDSIDGAYSGMPYFVSTGDVNADGRPDLVISENREDCVVFNEATLEGGGVQWSDPTTFRYLEGGDPGFGGNSLVADFDGDGLGDVLIADVDPEVASYGGRTHLYHNRGERDLVEERGEGWVGAAGFAEADLAGTHDAAAVDVDGDGRLDLVLARAAGTFVWVQAEPPAGPTFAALEGGFPGDTMWSESATTSDVDRDGDLDVLLARGEGWNRPGRKHQAGLFLNRLEEGAFRLEDESVPRLGYAEAHSKDVASGDLDGDGWEDAVFANAFNSAPPFLFMNRGAERPGYFRSEGDTRGLTEALSSAAVALGDSDNDGDLDLVLADAGPSFLGGPGGRARLYVNDGSASFREAPDRLAAPLKAGPMGLHLVDVDMDFDLDLVGPCRTGREGLGHYLMRNDGEGRFHDASHLLPETSTGVYEAECADLDGDEDVDLFFVSLTRTDDPSTRFPLGEGAMRNLLADPRPAEEGSDEEAEPELAFENAEAIGVDDDNEVVLFDHDMDGDLDAFIASLGPREKVLRNDGGLVFEEAPGVIEVIEDPTLDLTVADLDGDRAPDVITAQGLERIGAEQPPCLVYLNAGPRDRRAPRLVAVEPLPERTPPKGPWVVRAAVADEVVDDGRTWVEGEVHWVVNDEPARLEVRVEDLAAQAGVRTVAPGTTIVWTNATDAAFEIEGAAPFDHVTSGEVAPGASWERTFVRPGRYTLNVGSWFAVTTIEVAGEVRSAPGFGSGTGQLRFAMEGEGAVGGELVFQIGLVDRAGNSSVGEPVRAELQEPRRRSGRRRD